MSVGNYGDAGLVQSKEKHAERKFTDIKNLTPELEKQSVWLRGRLHTSRAKGISKSDQSIVKCVPLIKQL